MCSVVQLIACQDNPGARSLACKFTEFSTNCSNNKLIYYTVMRNKYTLKMYRVGQKTAPKFSCNNFGKYGPILIMFSLLHSQMN